MKALTMSLRKTLIAAALAVAAASVHATPVALTKLTGVTGGTLAATAVFKADLSGIGLATVLSIGISDNSAGLGGAAGQFSGFDLDAIKLSTTDCATAACAATASAAAVFDFVAGTFFIPGVQRAPADPKLFGTNAAGTALDDAVARLALFDGESSTATPDGFLSMGDTGQIFFNLGAGVSTAGLFLYIGEVGDNGEAAAGQIEVRDTRQLPEPSGAALVALALLGAGWARRR